MVNSSSRILGVEAIPIQAHLFLENIRLLWYNTNRHVQRVCLYQKETGEQSILMTQKRFTRRCRIILGYEGKGVRPPKVNSQSLHVMFKV